MQIQIPRERAYIHQGPTVQDTVPIPTVTVQNLGHWSPTRNDPNRLALGSGNIGPDPQFEGPTVQQTIPIPVAWPILPTLRRDDLNQRTPGPDPQFEGATVQPWFLYPTSQPTRGPYVPRVNQQLTGPDPQFEGPISQQTYVFTLSQPTRERERRVSGTTLPIDVVAVATQTDVFTLSQPTRDRFRLTDGSRTPIDVAVAAITQTDVFTLGQPDLRYQPPLHHQKRLTGPTAQLVGLWVTTDPTFIFPVNQPEWRYEGPRWAWRTMTGPWPVAPTGGLSCVCPPTTTAFPQIVND